MLLHHPCHLTVHHTTETENGVAVAALYAAIGIEHPENGTEITTMIEDQIIDASGSSRRPGRRCGMRVSDCQWLWGQNVQKSKFVDWRIRVFPKIPSETPTCVL